VFSVLASDGYRPKKVTEIADVLQTNADVLGESICNLPLHRALTREGRLMKHIAAMGYIKETGSNEYAPTNFSKALTIPIIGDGYPCLLVFFAFPSAKPPLLNNANPCSASGAHTSCSKFPEYMAMVNYEPSTDVESGPFQYAFNTKMDMMAYLQAHPPLGEQFNHHMGGYSQGRPSWMDTGFYPIEDRLIKGMDASPDAALLVDVGGSIGHDLHAFG
jgi:hypothetical protein